MMKRNKILLLLYPKVFSPIFIIKKKRRCQPSASHPWFNKFLVVPLLIQLALLVGYCILTLISILTRLVQLVYILTSNFNLLSEYIIQSAKYQRLGTGVFLLLLPWLVPFPEADSLIIIMCFSTMCTCWQICTCSFSSPPFLSCINGGMQNIPFCLVVFTFLTL